MADYDVDPLSRKHGGENYLLRGWMMMMRRRFNDEIKIVNTAKGGRSSKSFRKEGHWKKIESRLKPGDYVFIRSHF